MLERYCRVRCARSFDLLLVAAYVLANIACDNLCDDLLRTFETLRQIDLIALSFEA